MQGIELSRRFYFDVVRPWLSSAAPGLQHSAALVGYGSELLGLDDEMSRDHNWGPRVHLFIDRGSFDDHAHRLVSEFSTAAPTHFLGEPIGWRSRPHPPASGKDAVGVLEHGLEIHTLEATLERLLAVRSVDNLGPLHWLGFAEQRLLAFTGGAVFHDDDKRLTSARTALAYFPDDVWLYKIACQWRRIAEEQAFVGRAGQVGDDLGSRVVASRLVRDVMRMAFLLGRRYAPYSKWFGSAFGKLPFAEILSPLLQRVLLAERWQERGEALASAYLALAHRQLADGIGGEFEPVIGPYFERPFTTINADDLVEATIRRIENPRVKELPVVGSLDQVSDLTPLLENPSASQRMMTALLG
ncbi:MAG: hypothetical protein JWQ89_3149 [Devosia sp.]|uniref:DUF4037 domain-containing protein n=1 Tax=Devosia sp. TaxID=1871048 RepID=UPI00262D0FB6|nr:DUF4037 domain-containing protein [Devosia sp.]MDB5541422.1 hypothetical protein [Devosia sp.]